MSGLPSGRAPLEPSFPNKKIHRLLNLNISERATFACLEILTQMMPGGSENRKGKPLTWAALWQPSMS